MRLFTALRWIALVPCILAAGAGVWFVVATFCCWVDSMASGEGHLLPFSLFGRKASIPVVLEGLAEVPVCFQALASITAGYAALLVGRGLSPAPRERGESVVGVICLLLTVTWIATALARGRPSSVVAAVSVAGVPAVLYLLRWRNRRMARASSQ